MIVFDVDGTLLGGEGVDWASFDAALAHEAGFRATPDFFENLPEVTAQAIVHQALAALPLLERRRLETRVQADYLRRLMDAHAQDVRAFPAAYGAVELLRDLRARGVHVAIATGDWRESILFKLRAAGLDIDGIPLVTSSEHAARADIIAAAVALAGRPLAEACYVGDGLWDLRACRRLGIRFLGVGHRREKLRAAGALHLLDSLHPADFWPVHTAATAHAG